MALFAVNSVFAAQPAMSVHVADINAGETAHVSITLPSDASGVVTVSVNGQNYQANVVGGQASVDLTGLAAGSYTIKVKYDGAGNYSAVTKQANLKVSGSEPAPAPAENNDASANASGEPINASGEPANATPINNTLVTGNATDNSTNTTNTTNTTNNTTPNKNVDNKTPVKKPQKQQQKPHKYLENKKTGLPVLVLLLVVVGVVFGVSFRKR